MNLCGTGWNDELSEVLKRRKKEAGMAGRSEIQTMFTFIDADERPLIGQEPKTPTGAGLTEVTSDE